MTKGFVYLIEETDWATGPTTGYYKIGKTTNLESRIRGFRTASKDGLEYRKTIEVDDYSEAETAVHSACSEYRMHGEKAGKEWFDFRAVDISSIERAMDVTESQFPATTTFYAPQQETYTPNYAPAYRPSSSSYSESFFSISGCAQYLVALVLLLGVLALAQGKGNYEVMAGDTLSKLEREHGLPSGELRRQNPGIDHDNLKPGQRISLPDGQPNDMASAAPEPATTATHRISVGARNEAPAFDSPWVTQNKVASLPDGTQVNIIGATSDGQWAQTDKGWVHGTHMEQR
jgi:LysM repeat protein